AQQLAAKRSGVAEDKLKLEAATGNFWIFSATGSSSLLRRGWKGAVVVDAHGAIRLTAEGGYVFAGEPARVRAELSRNLAKQSSVLDVSPTITVIGGARLIRLTPQNDMQEALAAAGAALDEGASTEAVAAIVE